MLNSIIGRTWHQQRRRELFDAYAAKHRFDALVPKNWYPITPKDLVADKVRLAKLDELLNFVRNLTRSLDFGILDLCLRHLKNSILMWPLISGNSNRVSFCKIGNYIF